MLIKYDKTKPNWSLLPLATVEEVVKVMTFGAEKYSPGGWALGETEDAQQRYLAAALRHLVRWQEGEKRDKESGLNHLAHAACCLLFILWYDMQLNKGEELYNENKDTTNDAGGTVTFQDECGRVRVGRIDPDTHEIIGWNSCAGPNRIES